MRATVDRAGLDPQGRLPKIQIRRVRKGDLAKVRDVLEQSFGDFLERQLGTRPRQAFNGAQYVHHRWLMEPWGCFVAEEDQSKIVGTALGVTWGAVQHHFGGKDGLLLAVLPAETAPDPCALYVAGAWHDGGKIRGGDDFHEITSAIDAVWGPIVNLATGSLPGPLLFPLGLAVILASFKLLDRVLPAVDGERHADTRSHWLKRPWPMFLLGAVAALLTLSVSVALTILVPLASKGYISRREAIPYIAGANATTLADTLVAAMIIGTAEGVQVVLAQAVAVLAITMDGIEEQSIGKLIKRDPDNALGYYLQGTLLHQADKQTEAIEAFRKAAHCSELRLYESNTGPALFKSLDALNLTGRDRLCALSWMAARSSDFCSAALQPVKQALCEVARRSAPNQREEISELLLILAGHLYATNFQN